MALDRMEIREVAQGLWIWRVPDAHWTQGLTSTCVASGGEIALLDPIWPQQPAPEFWERLAERPPSMLVVLKPDHVRDVDRFARRWEGARAYGPFLFHRGDVPETDLAPIEPGSVLPGGLLCLEDGRWRAETPLYLPEQRTLVFADAFTAPEGELRVWASAAHESRALPALRALLELPFERVIVSHGEPVHARASYERALSLPPIDGDAV